MRVKAVIPVVLLAVLLTACNGGAPVPSTSALPQAEAANTLPACVAVPESPTPASLSVTDTPEPTPADNWLDPWDENYVPPASGDPMAICNLFPDPFFAYDVACLFDKNVTDTVTFEELAGYTGEFNARPGLLCSLEGIGYLTGLTKFGTCKNNLIELPPEIGNLTNLTELDLTKAFALERIPPEIGQLKQLRYLSLYMAQLEEIPKEIGQLENLQVLIASVTSITEVPEEIGNLKNLVILDLHCTDIESVPDSLCNLTSLLSLDISYTKLKALPGDIGRLKYLQRLDLFGCDLKALPASLKDIRGLRYLNVYDNFRLDEDYMKWFAPAVYECADDPENDEGWYDRWYRD